MADARYLGSMNPDELRKLGKQRAIEELAKRSTNRSEKPSGEDPSKGQYLGSMPPDELILRMELMRDKAKKDYLRENYESRNVLEDTAAALTAGTLQLAEMSARAARLGREPEDTPNLTKFIEGVDKFREDKQFLKPSREALTREGRRWLYEGVSSAIPSVGLGLPGAAVGSFGGPIGTVGGFAGSAGTVFGMAEFDEFWENARKGAKEGKIDPAMMSEINKKALMSAFAEGGMEAVSNAIDMLAFKVGKAVTAPLKESVRDMLTKGVKGVAKDMAKGYAVALPNEVATEMMQNYLTTKMRKDLGINEVEPIEAAKQSAGPAAVMTLLFGVGAAKFNYEQRLSALKALQDPDTKTKARMAAARAIADELKVYDDKHGTTYAKQWVGDSFSSIMRKKPVDIDSKIIKKYSQEPRKGEEPPEAEPPVQEAPPETPPPPPGSGEITGGPGTTPPPMGEDEPILPEDELDAEDAAKEHDEDDLDKIIETDDAADETDTEPTDAEIEAGNYKKGHVKLHGMDISIENPRGSTRKGADEDGKEWETTFTHHYGYIKGTVGRDKDHIDTFIGPNPASDRAFVVNQVNPKTGKFDEHKIMLGFDSIEEAQQGYLSNYEAGWTGLGSIHELDVEDLRTWTKDGDTKIEYDPQDYPEFHEETIDDEETVTGGAPGTPAPGGEIGITGGPRPQGETGGIGLPEDILKGLEEIFGEKPPAGEVQGEDEFKSTMDRMENDGWGFDGTNWLRKGDLAIRADTEEAEENRPPETMDDPVIFFFRNKNGDSDFKRYDTFREWVEEHLGEKKAQPEGGEGPGEITGGPRGDGGEKEAESEGEKPGGVTGGARAPVGEKESEGETKPSEGETPAPSGETKPEKPKKEESKQDKVVKAFDELSTRTTDETGKQAHAIVDHENAGQYGRLVDEVRNILADMTKSVKTMKGSPKEVQRAVENALGILKESRSWLDQITDEIKDLGQKMAEAFNGLTVYNKAQWLAREAADAVGEGRFNDAVRHLGEIKSRLDKGNADYSKWAMSFKMNEDGTLKPYTSLQEKGKLKWGKTIGGSRADIAQPLGGTEKDIEDMSDEERQKKVTKDFVWPTPNYEIMVNEGAEPHVAYLVKEIRDAIPQKPDLRDGTQYAKFIRQVSEIRDILMAVKTEDDMNATAERIKALREESTKTPWDLYTGDHWWKIVSLLQRATSKMYKKELRFIEENGWPGGGAWRRGIKIEQERSEEGHDVWAIMRRLGSGRYQYWSLMATGFETKEAAEEYLVNKLKPLIEKELKDRRMDRPILSKVVRKGPDYRGGKDIEPEKFLKTFGFRKGWGEEGAGMETGKWNKSILQTYLNCAYDSFMDLARILNVDPKVMSLNGTLSIAFGARGRGGKAAAHYESARKVINLTKFNGAGSLAHEWGHALDDYMGRSTGISGYLSKAAEDAYRAEVFAGDNETKRAMYELWHESMYKRYSTAEELESEVQRGIDANKGWVDSLVRDLERYKVDEAGIERFRAFANEIMSVKPDVASKRVGEIQTLFLQISKHDMSKKAASIMVDNFRYSAVKMREAEDVRAGNGRIGSLRKTKWYQNCSQVDPKGTYWRTPVEMFARAFESFVEDTITGYATQSDYLVHGTHSATYARPVYPDGGERELINAKIEKLVKTLGFPEFKVEDKPVITTIWDNPQYDQEEEGGDQVPSDQETKGEEEGPEVVMEDYSDKSFVIRDRTGKHKARIESAGGKFNPNLKGGSGYIFPMFRKESVTRELVDLLFGGEKGKPSYPYQNMTLEDLHKPDKYGLIAKNMLVMLKSGWHIDKNATAIRAEVARMLNGDPKELVSGYGYTKIIDELMEYAVVMRAREIIQAADANDVSESDLYSQLKELYDTQPMLGARTSDSAERQAYSTPVHIGWIMQAAAGVRDGVSVYEPTAGTGMLLTKADESKAMVNEIDEMRLNILKDQGFANVMNKDGQKAVSLAGANRTFDVVMANPPFGKTDTKSIDGYLMSKKEHLIAVDALKAMKEDGVAAIIIGGHNYDGDKMSTPDRLFFNWLYSRYNVTANVEIPGKEYAKQGASFPFRILFINGVNKSGKGVAPSKKDIISLNSADELFALFRKGELYGARRLSAEGTEGVSKGPEVMGGSRQPGSKGGSTGVRPGVSGEAGDDDGQGKVRRGSSGGSSGGIGGGRGKPGGEDAGEPGGSEGVLGNDELSPEGSEPGGSEEGVGAGSGKGRGPQRGGAVRTGGQTDAEGIPGLSPIENELTSLTDDGIGDLLDDVFGKEATAGEIALKAGSEVAEGIHEAVKGLSTLFTPKETTLTMGIVFDEETYAKARPHFENAWESFKAAGKTLKDLLVYLKGKYGDKILPYVKRFLQDMQDAVSNLHQVPYKAMSKAPAVEETFIPRNMALPLRRALERIEEEVGDIDDFVTEKLEYKDNETLWKHLGPDQVDACAIAIYNMSMGKTAIIGDQTGVGKGRVAAAMIRYAHLQGKRAIFFTEKANLFTDIYRDIVDVGWGDKFKPFILASDPKLATIYDKNGAPAFKLMDDEKRRDLLRKFVGKDVQKNPAVLDPFNTIVTNYSQVNKANLQQEFLMEAVPGSVLILDEAHNASGIDSTTGLYMQEMIEHLGVEGDLMFLSATFAKRPNTMGIYINRTAQKAANMEPGEILDAIIRGKTPMQEYVCSALTRVGEYLRREKSFRGIEMRTYYDSKNRELHEEQANANTRNLREIVDFDKELKKWLDQVIHEAANGDIDDELEIGGVQWIPGGEIVNNKRSFSTTVTKANFASTVHNAVRQSLLCMKCDLAVEQAIKELKGDNENGRRQKPVIAVSSTLGSFLKEMHDEKLIQLGQEANMRLADVIRVYLKRCLKLTLKDDHGKKEVYFMDPKQLPKKLRDRYFAVEKAILDTTPDLPGSPIDYMLYKLRAAGVKVDEITGRGHCIEYDAKTGKGKFTYREDRRAAAIRDFNSGELDALVINAAGSVGLSIHAAPNTDKVPRIYLGVQAELNIDTEVQKMGRINRKGQVVLPEYRTLVLDIPAEIRPAAVLAKKMRSMSANTSANADSPLQNKEVPDMLNEYGDKVTYEWMMDHPDVLYRTFADKDPENIGKEDLVYEKVSGKIAIQPVDVQREFFEEAEESYNIMKEDMQKRGEWDLDIETWDYKADTVSKDITVEGSDEDNPFGGSTFIEEVTVENKAKPYRADQIQKMISDELGGKTAEDYNAAILNDLQAKYNEYRQQVLDKWEETKRLRKEREEAEAKAAEEEGTAPPPRHHGGDESKPPAIIKKMEDQLRTLQRALGDRYDALQVGKLYTIEQNIKLRGVLLRIESLGKTGNPVNLNKIKLTFACNGMYQELSVMLGDITMSERADDKYYVTELHDDLENWDARLEPLMRENRFMVTGNLLQGFVNLPEGTRGAKLIRYTTIDNQTREGIILPRGFQSPAESPVSLVRISPKKCIPFMNAKGINRDDQVLIDDNAGVRVTSDIIRVPKSRSRGYKFWGDPELQKLVRQGIFEKSGEDYVGRYLPESRESVVRILTALGCRFSVRRGAYNMVFGGMEDQDDLAEFALGGKKVAQNQLLVSAINNAIAPITEKWGGGPRIYVLENIGKLPDGLREQAYRANSSSPGSVRGIYHRGSVYLIAENLSGAAEAQEVLLHEIIGHHGLRRAFGRRLDSLLDEVFSLMSKKDKDLVNKYYGFNLSRKSGQRRLAEEYIAKQAEKGALTPTIWQKIIAAIRKWLAEMGFSIKASDEKLQEIVTHALSMSRMYMNSEEATEGPDAYSIAEDKPEIDTKSLFPEVQKRLDEAKGIGNLVRTKEKAKHHVSAMWHSFRRHFPHLDPDETGDLINILRIYEAVPEYSKYKAKGMIEDILGGLTDDEYTVFSYNIILADLMKDLDDPILGATMIEKDELPFGYTNKDQVEKDLNHFRDQAIKSPAIMEALRKREKSITDLRHNLVRYGLLDKKVLEDTNYYHHQVMEYWGLKRMTKGAGVSSKDVRPHKKGWMIAREGSIKDYNTEYIESEFEVFAQGIAQVETKKTMDRLDRSANIIKSLRAQAKLKNYGACLAIFEEMGLIERVENEKTGEMREITPFTPIEQQIAIGFSMLEKLAFDDKLEAPQEYQGVLDWLAHEYLNRKEDREYGFFDGIDDSPTHPKLWAYLSYIVQRKDPGSGAAARIFKGIKEKERLMKDTLGAKFRTFENEIPEGYTIWRPEPNTAWYMTNSITDQVLEQVLKGEKSLKDEDVRKVLARGVDAMWVIPEGLAATLSNFREYKDEGPVGKAAEFTVTSWKQWILINPFRVIKYNLNNMSGDFDICWAYDPDIIRKYAWGAAKDLWMEARHKEISPVLKAELEEAHRVGVLGTGMTVQDIPDITNQMTLDGYLEVLSGRNVSYISKTWNVLKKYTTYRENILRLASYRYFRDRIISGEKNIYGASNADMIDKIKNDTDRAAHLARELVGDYGNITVAGQWMRRKLIPFYSWCVPEYTEILTREGWKTYDQLRVGEEALTYNIQKRTTEWQEVQDKAAYPFDGDLVTIQNSYGFKYQFTEDHRVVVIEKYKDQRKVVLAKDLKTHQHIPLVAPHEFTGVSVLSETDAALLGWLVTDGYFRVRAKSPNSFEAMLYQKKAECVELIRDKFAEYISSESVHPETGVICFRLKAAKLGEIRKVFGSKDDLPGIVTQLGEKECQAMYDAMLAAEGTAVNGFVAFPQNNGPVLGAFQILCYMLGKAGHIRPKTCRGKEQHSLYVKKGDKIQLSKWKNTREHYNGMVWCPKTENGTWIMRQNGKVMITGNCEINAPRYVRLFHNLPMEGEGRGRLATALSAKLAGKAFKLSAKMMTLYGLVVLWNMIFFPDEEDELGDMQRRQLHLILGRRGDGSIITVRFQGALSDALSWFGLENPAKELSDLAEGRKAWGEQGWELIKSAPNRFINSAQPFVKLAAETLMGKSLFPDAFNPRPIRDRVEHASRMFSLENIYKHAAGKPTRNQWREIDFWQDFLYLWGYEQLPGEAAYFDTRERVRRFLDRKGLNPGYFQADSSSKSAALYNYRRAMQLGDVEVAKKNYDRYMELGGTKQSMKTSMRLSHPAAGIPKKHREEFYRSLTERDRERMQAAVEWYNTIYGGM